jgi:flagellar biosynthesis regulator FlbT
LLTHLDKVLFHMPVSQNFLLYNLFHHLLVQDLYTYVFVIGCLHHMLQDKMTMVSNQSIFHQLKTIDGYVYWRTVYEQFPSSCFIR